MPSPCSNYVFEFRVITTAPETDNSRMSVRPTVYESEQFKKDTITIEKHERSTSLRDQWPMGPTSHAPLREDRQTVGLLGSWSCESKKVSRSLKSYNY